MPVLETPGGAPVEVTPAGDAAVNARFRAAMDSDGPDEQAPPKKAPRTAPDAGDTPKPRRGRPPKAEQSRTTEKTAAPVKDDYTADAQQLVGAVWTVAASLPPTQAYALVIEGNSDALVSALAEGAKHNSSIRSFVAAGESSWILGLASVSVGMTLQMYQLMRDPALREQAAATTREHLQAAMGAKASFAGESADVPAAAAA